MVRAGLASERNRANEETSFGIEISPDVSWEFHPGNSLLSETRFYWSPQGRQGLSMQSYNHFSFTLSGRLSATIDGNLFFRFDDDVGRAGIKLEFLAGLGYTWKNN